ncbi:MAG: apolipoprotein N-acyltransferase [Elusimicrobia bacterium]|nr:apolipoprotein N-acyltransferase [Elusimicrobiota bacterium]
MGCEPRGPAIKFAGSCAASGILLTLCFPKFNLGWLAWTSLLPLTLAVLTPGAPKRSFYGGWLAGALAYAGILYWIIPTCRMGNVSWPLAALALLALSLYMGLFVGLWAAGTAWAGLHLPSAGIALMGAALWTSLEFIKGSLWGGFPWMLLGYSQWRFPPIMQICSITGIYGLGFVITLVNVTLALAISRRQARANPAMWAPAVLALAFSFSYGYQTLRHNPAGAASPGPQSRICILQPNIDQYKKWNAEYEKESRESLTRLAEQAAVVKPELIVWPEASLPGWWNDPDYALWLSALARKSGAYHLVGTPLADSRGHRNAAILISPRGAWENSYFKQHLVPFGEQIPFPFLEGFIPVLNALGGVSAGSRGQMPMPSPVGTLGVNICYEAIFPAISRRAAQNGAHILVNLTNDAWYLETAAPYQHWVMNVARAIETRRWVIRSANTGISGVIDPYGRIIAQTRLQVRDVLEFTAPSGAPAAGTVYSRFGDFFVYFCAGYCLLCWGIFSLRQALRQP